jgi:uncharacterized protein (TIGR02246 family)
MGSQASKAQETNDERAIRELVDKWLAASKKGDLGTMLGLLADDVIFMVPNKEPFGKKEFAASNEEMKDVHMDIVSDIHEIKVLGDWAWMRNHLDVTFAPAKGEAARHSGYVLTILRKNPNGTWVIARDANLLTAQTKK